MQKWLFWCLFGLACPAAAQELTYKTLSVDVKSPKGAYTFKNLRLYPIRAKAGFAQNIAYTPLRSALAGKKISAQETEGISNIDTRNDAPTNRQDLPTRQNQTRGDGAVNSLRLENLSKDTIYIMAGEILQGGKQDRIIAQDIVLLPESGVVTVKVFCVEQGRWKYKEGNKDFAEHYGAGGQNLRKIVEKSANQQAVWSEVRRSNNENNINSATDAYTEQRNSPYLKKNTAEYLAYFAEAFASEKDVLGVLIVTGDRVLGCDIFASPALFRAELPTLLLAYTTEALTYGAQVSIEPKQASIYLDNLLKDEASQRIFIEQKGKIFEFGGKRVRVSTF